MLRFLTAGESHGKALTAILEGMPAGLRIDKKYINNELKRRQQGIGRGKRMSIEQDEADIIAGLKNNISLGSPIALLVKNKDTSIESLPPVFCPRPGHADLAGLLKYGFKDGRNVLERASARETAARVAVGAVCKILLSEFKISVSSKVISIASAEVIEEMEEKVREAQVAKDTVGGIFKVVVDNVPAGLGSYVQYDRRLDASLAQAVISIPGVKGLEFGLGFGYASSFGSEVHDPIIYSKSKGYGRTSNNAGGIEGGVTNGQEIVIQAVMKPIATLLNPLASVDIRNKKVARGSVERSDICAVESAAVVAEAVVAFALAQALLEKFGSDSLLDIKESFKRYLKRIS